MRAEPETRSPASGKLALVALVLLSLSLFVVFHDYTPEHDVAATQTAAAAAEHHETPHLDVLCALLVVGSAIVVSRCRPGELVWISPQVALKNWTGLTRAPSRTDRLPRIYDFSPMLA